jgi:hypothetical protein
VAGRYRALNWFCAQHDKWQRRQAKGCEGHNRWLTI